MHASQLRAAGLQAELRSNRTRFEEHSRLACQCVPDGSTDLVVEVPSWNRNLVREAPH